MKIACGFQGDEAKRPVVEALLEKGWWWNIWYILFQCNGNNLLLIVKFDYISNGGCFSQWSSTIQYITRNALRRKAMFVHALKVMYAFIIDLDYCPLFIYHLYMMQSSCFWVSTLVWWKSCQCYRVHFLGCMLCMCLQPEKFFVTEKKGD